MEFFKLAIIWAFITYIGGEAESIANFILVFAFLKWVWGFRKKSFYFNDGEKNFAVTMRAKDVNPQSLTNVVSMAQYNGGIIPPAIRQQIIIATAPKYWVVEKK